MIGILLITHGAFGEALVQNACHVLGHRPAQLVQLGLAPQDDPASLVPLAEALRQAVDSGDGVLVLTDIFGASPANLAVRLLVPGQVEALAGLNLPMLLRAINSREQGFSYLIGRAAGGARDGVIHMGESGTC